METFWFQLIRIVLESGR